eukprot:7334620-Prymnesium_polylepis.1
MANAPRRSRWSSRLLSRAHRPHSSHEPSMQSSGDPHEAREPAEGRVVEGSRFVFKRTLEIQTTIPSKRYALLHL